MRRNPVMQVELPGAPKVKSGKVREIFDLGDRYLLVATDRISAFDCVMPNGIPGKGEVLTQISHFWFDWTESIVGNHRILRASDPLPEELCGCSEILAGRTMVVKKAKPLPIECVARGYLAGSGWKEYQKSGMVCGIQLPPGLRESEALPEPIFTPATKAESGHDENISFEQARELVGEETGRRVRDLTLDIFKRAGAYARERGIIIADTKFEFGRDAEGQLILIDEVLTPDSSRFWPVDGYKPGGAQPSFDKQFVRDYLETLDWNKTPPAPKLPDDVVIKTREKYLDAYFRLTGARLDESQS